MNYILKLFNIGIRQDESLPEWLVDRIRLSNMLCVFFVFSALPVLYYLGYNLKMFPGILFLGLLAVLMVLPLNFLAYYNASRLFVSIGPVAMVTLIHCLVVPEGEKQIVEFSIIALSLSLSPFVVFDLRNSFLLHLTSIINFLMLVGFGVFNIWLESNKWNESYGEWDLPQVVLFFGPFMAIATGYLFTYQLNDTGERNDRLNAEKKELYDALEHSKKEMENYVQEISSVKEIESRRNWQVKGMSMIDTIIRESNDMNALAGMLISNLVKYSEANQGGLFILRTDESGLQFFDLLSCYAYDRQKFLKKKIGLKESMMGQSFKQQKPIFLTEIPEDYVNISSGLGLAKPRSIYIVPLLFEAKVEGMLEIASFEEMPLYKRELMDQVSQALAAYLTRVRIAQENDKRLNEYESEMQQLTYNYRSLLEEKEKTVSNRLQLERFNEYEKEVNIKLKDQVDAYERAMNEMKVKEEHGRNIEQRLEERIDQLVKENKEKQKRIDELQKRLWNLE